MTLEYVLLLVVSVGILLGAFGVKTGPVQMVSTSSPVLAYRIQKRMITGYDFSQRADGEVQWRRK